jgi:hypothetical protein
MLSPNVGRKKRSANYRPLYFPSTKKKVGTVFSGTSPVSHIQTHAQTAQQYKNSNRPVQKV